MSFPFVIRAATDEDRPYIENAWRSTLLAASLAPGLITPKHFHYEMSRVFGRLLPAATVRVACDPKDHSNLVGFAAATAHELHYAYVTGGFRQLGIVPAMLEGLKITKMTFLTMAGLRRMKPKERGWSYCPRWTIF